MLPAETRINFLAVLIAAAAYFLLGTLWYSPKFFGNQWRKHDGPLHSMVDHPPSVWSYIGEFILALIMAYILAVFLEIARAQDWLKSLVVALWIWVGFIATTQVSAMIWGKKSLKSFVINAGFVLAGLLLMGVIIGALQGYKF